MINQKFVLLLLLLALTCPSAKAQPATGPAGNYWGLSAGYFGETLTHYGLKLGVEHSFSQWQRQSSRRRPRPRTSDLIGSLNLATYRHPHNHYGLIAQTEWGIRRTKLRGSTFDFGLSAGYLRTVLDGEAYQVRENGSFERIRWAGRGAFLPGVYIGWGKDLARTTNLPLLWRVKPYLLLQTPYNTSVLPRLALEISVVYQLNHR